MYLKLLLPAQKMLLEFTLTLPTTPLRKSGQARTFPLWVTWEAGQLLARTLIYSVEEGKISWYNIQKTYLHSFKYSCFKSLLH